MLDVFTRGGPLRELSPTALIDLQEKASWKAMDEAPFAFSHRLAAHPLFTIPQIARLSQRVFDRPDYRRYFPLDQRSLPKQELARRIRQDICDIGSNGRWLALHYVDEMDPAYNELFELMLVDIEDLTGLPIRRRMSWGGMSIFMNSPGLKVPYHFDHETNFLMQVQGEKEVRLYPRGLATLSIEELEDFYHENPMAGRWRDELSDAGASFVLKPGTGVHHPPLAPHFLRNGSEVSVSVSIYFAMPEMDYQARVHQANYCLRMLGLHPRLPGSSVYWDRVKSGVMERLSKSNPRTRDEFLYSAVQRLGTPFRVAKAVKRRVTQPVRMRERSAAPGADASS